MLPKESLSGFLERRITLLLVQQKQIRLLEKYGLMLVGKLMYIEINKKTRNELCGKSMLRHRRKALNLSQFTHLLILAGLMTSAFSQEYLLIPCRKLAAELGFRQYAPTPLFKDNKCIALAEHGHFAGMSEHIHLS